jgi:hypothetical protein
MKMRMHGLGVAIVLSTFACAPGADEPEEMPEDTNPSPTSQEFAEFRGEVTESFDEIRAELAEMRESVQAESAETWEELSGSAQRASDEVMADLDRLGDATAEEARQIQRAAGDRLAELEAEVARRDVENSPDPASLIEAMNERLAALEADLDAIWAESGAEIVDTVPPPPGTPTDQSMVSDQEIFDLRARLVEMRAELDRIATATGAEFDAAREDLGEDVAELTREVCREWYETQWGLDEAA